MNIMTKLNMLHDLALLTDNRPLGPWSDSVEEVEMDLSLWAFRNFNNDGYLSLPLPEKLTAVELKWVLKVLGA